MLLGERNWKIVFAYTSPSYNQAFPVALIGNSTLLPHTFQLTNEEEAPISGEIDQRQAFLRKTNEKKPPFPWADNPCARGQLGAELEMDLLNYAVWEPPQK